MTMETRREQFSERTTIFPRGGLHKPQGRRSLFLHLVPPRSSYTRHELFSPSVIFFLRQNGRRFIIPTKFKLFLPFFFRFFFPLSHLSSFFLFLLYIEHLKLCIDLTNTAYITLCMAKRYSKNKRTRFFVNLEHLQKKKNYKCFLSSFLLLLFFKLIFFFFFTRIV